MSPIGADPYNPRGEFVLAIDGGVALHGSFAGANVGSREGDTLWREGERGPVPVGHVPGSPFVEVEARILYAEAGDATVDGTKTPGMLNDDWRSWPFAIPHEIRRTQLAFEIVRAMRELRDDEESPASEPMPPIEVTIDYRDKDVDTTYQGCVGIIVGVCAHEDGYYGRGYDVQLEGMDVGATRCFPVHDLKLMNPRPQ